MCLNIASIGVQVDGFLTPGHSVSDGLGPSLLRVVGRWPLAAFFVGFYAVAGLAWLLGFLTIWAIETAFGK